MSEILQQPEQVMFEIHPVYKALLGNRQKKARKILETSQKIKEVTKKYRSLICLKKENKRQEIFAKTKLLEITVLRKTKFYLKRKTMVKLHPRRARERSNRAPEER